MSNRALLIFLFFGITLFQSDLKSQNRSSSMDGCEEERKSCLNYLENTKEIGYDPKSEKHYKKGELVFSLPSKNPRPRDKDVIMRIQKIIYPHQSIINTPKTRPEPEPKLVPCICEQNIWLYIDSRIIGKEVELAQNNTTESAKEGGVLSLNYIFGKEKPKMPKELNTFVSGNQLLLSEIETNSLVNNSTDATKIAFLDTGISPIYISENSLFPQIKNPINCERNYGYGWDFINNDPLPTDDDGHGLMVHAAFMNTLLRSCNNLNPLEKYKSSLASANLNIQQLFVKTLDECGYGTSFSNACGIHYARLHEVDYINCSWGFTGRDPQIERAIQEAVASSIKIICSSGNKGYNLSTRKYDHFPSAYTTNFDSNVNFSSGERSQFNNYVYEISGLCIPPSFISSGVNRSSVVRWENANYREKTLAEPAVDYQLLISSIVPNISCSINGTSFAAPSALAQMVKIFGNNDFQKPILFNNQLPNNRRSELSIMGDDCVSLSYFPCNRKPTPIERKSKN